MDLKERIRHVPDFPKAGILFYDITTLLREPDGFKATIDMLSMPSRRPISWNTEPTRSKCTKTRSPPATGC